LSFAYFSPALPAGMKAMSNISDVAVSASGHAFVSDYANNRIVELDASGAYVAAYGTKGSGTGKLSGPMGIAIDDAGYIYVADSGNSRIARFLPSDFTGTWQTYCTNGNGTMQLNRALGVCVKNGIIYVADSYNSRIVSFDTAGSNWNAYGTKGSGEGCFNMPCDLGMDSKGNLWVSDTGNKRVVKLVQGDTWSYGGAFGCDYVYGLAIDKYDNVFVAERMLGDVKCVTTGAVYGGKGAGAGKFTNTYGLFITCDGYLWVTDATSNKIQKTEITY
jgi:DNA-binding beta-propeller fold protein YncE